MGRFEGSGKSRREFAADAGVGLAIFQYWLYKLRRERDAATVRRPAVAEVRLVPVTVRARPKASPRLEIRVTGVRIRIPIGADPSYVAQLAMALRESRSC